MATTSTDPRDIEADLERERAALADTLDTLSDRVSVDHLAKEALGMLKSNAGYATSTIDHAVRANPLAVALIGAGIAWMFLGPRITGSSSSSSSSKYIGRQSQSSGYADATSSSVGSTTPAYGSSSYETATSGPYGAPSSSSSSSSYAGGSSGSYGASSGSADYGRVGYVPSDNDEDHAWSREAHGLRARASEALHAIEREAKSYYDSLRSGISGLTSGSGSGGERDFDAERQGVISRFSSDLKDRFSSGLDNLPPEARDRVIAARERAYGAMLQAERLGKDAWSNPGRVMEEHPFVAGSVAFALGAATAALLPSTEVENRTFGSERDRLMGEAARLLREERGRAMQIAGSLGQEIKQAAQETVGAVAETVTQKASEAASRVGDRATEEVRSAAESFGSSSSVGSSGSLSAGSSGSSSGSSSGLRGPGDPVIG